VVFPALHGPLGEDGTVQGALDLMDIPYVGSGVAASATAMDKPLAKRVFRGVGLPVAAEVVVEPEAFARDAAAICERTVSELGLPIFVKPARLGSSVGVYRVDDAEGLRPALAECLRHNGTALAEAFLAGRELTAPVIEEPETGELRALPLIEIRAIGHAFFDYTSKYTEGHNEELCPAPLPDDLAVGIADLALRAHRALGCRGMSRTDVILTDKGPVILETNTIPGLTAASLIPKAAAAAGLSFDAFVSGLVACAVARPAR
jgi:D-alanine-D-alanine ligase